MVAMVEDGEEGSCFLGFPVFHHQLAPFRRHLGMSENKVCCTPWFIVVKFVFIYHDSSFGVHY